MPQALTTNSQASTRKGALHFPHPLTGVNDSSQTKKAQEKEQLSFILCPLLFVPASRL